MTRARGTALGAVALAGWSCYGVLVASNDQTQPFRAMAVVFTVATLTLLLARLARGGNPLDLLRIPPATLGLGLIGLFGSNVLYVVALELGGAPVPVNIASLAWPVFMVVLIAAAGIARVTWLDGAAMAVGFGGVMLLTLQKGAAAFDWQVGIAVAGSLCWAIYSALRNLVPPGPPDAMTGFVAVSAVLCWIMTLAFETGAMPMDEFLRLCLVGLLPVGLANLAWDHGARYGDPVLLAGLSLLEPVASTALVAVILAQPVGWTDALAMALILSAVLCSLASERLRRRSICPLEGRDGPGRLPSGH